MAAAIVIPARYGAERFPGKLLALLDGAPVIVHTVRAAKRARLATQVVVACDDTRIATAVEREDVRVVRVDAACPSGTDRVAIAARTLDCEIVVNVQGDEPFVDPGLVDALIDRAAGGVGIATAMTPCRSEEEARSPGVVKVVRRSDGSALYFSRSWIPYPRTPGELPFRHIGVYAFGASTLQRVHALPVSALERSERLEQLRWLEAGERIDVVLAGSSTIGIDTPEDLRRAQAFAQDPRVGQATSSAARLGRTK